MMLADTNVLVYAHRHEVERHEEYRDWVEGIINGAEPYAVADFAVTGMVRLVTNRRIYKEATPIEVALSYADRIRNQPHATVLNPGAMFWSIFTELCQRVNAHAKLVPDAYLAALAIENACEFITADRDFRRFPGLRCRHPLV
jgi:toxin-antitoxin system PIN domain toxin